MNLKTKDIILLAMVILVSFPMVYFGILFTTGNARIEFGPAKKAVLEEKKIEVFKPSAKAESLAVVNSKTYQALLLESSEIAKQREGLMAEHKSLEMFQNDLEAKKAELRKEQQQIEYLVSKSDTLERKKTAQLAKVYSAMRPAEAAQILTTLTNELAARILDGIGDDRQKAKILSALPGEKATQITQLMGGSSKRKR
jgi:flagellar motility protein MotE (MotC chaperone)